MILTSMVQLFTKQFLIKIVLTVVLSDQLSYCWHQLMLLLLTSIFFKNEHQHIFEPPHIHIKSFSFF